MLRGSSAAPKATFVPTASGMSSVGFGDVPGPQGDLVGVRTTRAWQGEEAAAPVIPKEPGKGETRLGSHWESGVGLGGRWRGGKEGQGQNRPGRSEFQLLSIVPKGGTFPVLLYCP